VAEMQTGKSFEEAKKAAEDKFKEPPAVVEPEKSGTQTEAQKRNKKRQAALSALAEDNPTSQVATQEDKVQQEELKVETKGNTVPETKGGTEASKKVAEDGKPFEEKKTPAEEKKEKEAAPVDQAADTVKKLDTIAEEIEKDVEKKKETASLFAKAGMKDLSQKIVAKIQASVARVALLDKLAGEVEETEEDIEKASASNKKILQDKLASLIKKCEDEMSETKKEMEEEKKEDDEKEAKLKEAKQIHATTLENLKLKKENEKLKASYANQVKNKYVANVVRSLVDKGLISAAEMPKKTAELLAMADESLIQFNKSIQGLPKVSVQADGNKHVREAMRGLRTMQTGIIQKSASANGGVGTGLLDKGEMFN